MCMGCTLYPVCGSCSGGETMAHILAVDDDADLRAVIAEALGRDGPVVRLLPAGAEVTGAHCRWADLIQLDLRMPGENGAVTCRRIRALTDAPILFLTALNAEADVLEALRSGGDDYLTKPFRIGELRARVAAHLRRQQRTPAHRVERGGVVLEQAAGTAGTDRGPVPLAKGDYAICEAPALPAGQTFGQGQRYTEAFGYERAADASAVTEHIKIIRAKFRAAGCEPVETVWGVGYRWKR